MLCRCFHRPSAPVEGRASTEPTPVFSAWSATSEFLKTLPAPAAHTFVGGRCATCGNLLVQLQSEAFASGFWVPSARCPLCASPQGRCSAGAATPAHPSSSSLKGPRPYFWRKPALRPIATQVRHSTVRRAEPNPSFKPSPNGGSRWPSSAGPAAHFALAVQHAPPSVPA